MSKLHYNFIVFNNKESKYKLNKNAYYAICLMDLYNMKGVENVFSPLYHKNRLLQFLYYLHTSKRINKYINLPFKSIWFPLYVKNDFIDKKPLCFVFGDRLSLDYWAYVKKKYPDCKIVMLHRDLRRLTEQKNPAYLTSNLIDLQMSIDAEESNKYGMIFFHEFESKIKIPISDNYPESDIFFAGKAKDRLPRLMHAYEIFRNAGLNVKYYLTEVPETDQKLLPGIEYANKPMPYTDMLYHTINTRCILEINQAEAVGYTSRFLEAIMYNKRLITDNKEVKKSKFYTPENILCINDISDIDPRFISREGNVNYNYHDEFSPIHLIKQIDDILVNRYGKGSGL